MSLARGQKLELALLILVGILPFELNGWYNPILAERPPMFWAVELFTWIAMPVAIYLIARRRKLITSADIGLTWNLRGRPMPITLICLTMILTIALYFLNRASVRWGLAIWPTNPGRRGFTYSQVLPAPDPRWGWLRLLASVYMGGSGGIVEEVYYRGMMRRLFRPGLAGAVAFTVTSTAIFASVHWEFGLVGMFEAATWGFVACILYCLMRNLWPLVIAHTVIDYLWLINF